MITRDVPFTLRALEDREVITCSTASQVFSSTANTVRSSAADYTSGVGVSGRIIDRLADIFVSRYYVAAPVAYLHATRGSTEANRNLQLAIKLQHGDSSGGGDMADYSTQNMPDAKNFFGTARTSDFASWDGSQSTGAFFGSSNPCYYDIKAAKRYLRVVAFATKSKVTTESSGDEGARLSADIVFLGGDKILQNADTRATSTSTTT